ncbi:MAG: hypothetical protein QOI15_680 [Pseudonocardiales bacterium]|nr:hypothetical protein [Pseudonocardiales bacterium]MDT4919778.1 hypothetical protein [Pseudonocardiales bacterium]
MSVVQTVLVFVAIPLGVVLLVALAVYGKSLVRQPNRYRPGKPWTYPASWYVPHPDAVVAHPAAGATTTAVGGASGEW